LRNDLLCLCSVTLRMRNTDYDIARTGSVATMAEGVSLCAKERRRVQTCLNNRETGLVSGPTTKERETMGMVCAHHLCEASTIFGIHALTR